jgi:hypothetical protein
MSIKYFTNTWSIGFDDSEMRKNERRIDDSISLTISTTITELFSKLELEDNVRLISRKRVSGMVTNTLVF